MFSPKQKNCGLIAVGAVVALLSVPLTGLLDSQGWFDQDSAESKVLSVQPVAVAASLASPRATFPATPNPKPASKPVFRPTPRPTPTPRLTPRSTPKPDPLSKARSANEIPNWAKGRVLHKVPVKPGKKVLALTFDDGPDPRYTEQILNLLASYDVKATFYMVGKMVQAHPKIARQVRDAGHAIGNHSWDHPSRPRDPVAQVERTDEAIEKAVGFAPSTFRPPYGIVKNGMAKQAMKEAQCVLIWSADSNDWKRTSAERIARTIIRQAGPGGVALLHDGGGNRSRTVAALAIILRELSDRGYRFVTVPELLRMRYIAPRKAKRSIKSSSQSTLGAKKAIKPLTSRNKLASR